MVARVAAWGHDVGGTIIYWAGDARKIVAKLATAGAAIRAAPRIYDKVHTAAVDAVEATASQVGGALLRWALVQGRRARAATRSGRRLDPIASAQYWLAGRLVLARVGRPFGDRLVVAVVGAAPIAPAWSNSSTLAACG
jgi:long-subunit acyl-CoA synthetase (AMP-forming)